MIHKRLGEDRGRTLIDWLDSHHTFSFGDYFDRQQVRFRSLRVINEDRIAPGKGFGSHPHHDMEILTWVLSGELAHRDSLGNGSIIHANDLQRMTAGRGIVHSELNPSFTHPVHLLQIWIQPEAKGLSPGYEQQHFDPADRRDRWQVLAMNHRLRSETYPAAVAFHADATVYAAHLSQGHALRLPETRPGRGQWLQIVDGMIDFAGHLLRSGDAIGIEDEPPDLEVRAEVPSELLLFDLA